MTPPTAETGCKPMSSVVGIARKNLVQDRLRPRCKADYDRLALIKSSRPDEEVWLDVRGAELYLQVDRSKIYRRVESGKLPCMRMGRRVLIRKADLDRVFGVKESKA